MLSLKKALSLIDFEIVNISVLSPNLLRNLQVMSAIEGMWLLEEECGVLEQKFQGFVGCSWEELDIDNVDVDFIEDLMLRAKPMNDSLSDVRGRQMKKLAEVKSND